MLEKSLEEIEERIRHYRDNATAEYVDVCAGLREAQDIIRKHMNDGWIPVEKKPKKSGYYLVQLSRKLPNEDYSDRVVVLYIAEEKEFMTYSSLIIAWRPLPEPYCQKGAEE